MQYTYPQQYIFIPSDLTSGLASGIFIIASVALFVMFRKFVLNMYQRRDKLMALSNFLYMLAIMIFSAEAIFYIWQKTFLDEYVVLSLIGVIAGIIVVLGIPEFRWIVLAFSAIILILIPIEIPPLSYTVQSMYTVNIKLIPLQIFITGLIAYLIFMFVITRVYGPLSLAISLGVFSVLLFTIRTGVIVVDTFSEMELHVLSFVFYISSGLFGSEKTIISSLDKTFAAYLVSVGVGMILYTLQISIPLAITLGGLILFGGVAAYFSTIFESKYYKFKDTPSLLLSLGNLSLGLVAMLLMPNILLAYGISLSIFMDYTIYTTVIFEMLLLTVLLFAFASLTIIRQQKFISFMTFLAGISAAVAAVNPFVYRSILVVVDAIISAIPISIFLRFGYKLYKMGSSGTSVTISIGLVLLIYIVSFGALLQFGVLSLLGAIVFLFLAIATTLISIYGIIIIPGSRSVKK